MNATIKTTCPYCGVGCGIEAQVDVAAHEVIIKGDKNHPANYGRLCSKGSALGETVTLNGRLLTPKLYERNCSWDEALNRIAGTFRAIIDCHGPDAVALYGSGQLLTEDYYVANKFMKGFIGSANIDTNSRLCMSSSVAGHKRAFGADCVPGCYDDYEQADLIVLVGSNAAWCHPVSFQRIRAAKTVNPDMKIVVIDPRRTASCDIADLHLPLAPGSDVVLFNGLLSYLYHQHRVDTGYIKNHTDGFANAIAAVRNLDVKTVAAQCQLPVTDVESFYRWFTEYVKVMSLYSQGVNQSSSGVDKVNSIINCHLATGRIGKPGMGPFSLTGQPNAMGGREVGGLSHQLAAHMDFSSPDDIERVARFWGSSQIATRPGYSAVELFDAIYQGKVKAVWIMGTNPVVSLPDADKVKQALRRCEFVVVSDCIAETDTSAFAHALLPAAGWSEKDGTVTNSERRISRQRALFPSAGEAMPDWWIISQVARRMGFEKYFSYQNAWEIFREHAALSGFENGVEYGIRDFDISGLSQLSRRKYDELSPIQWPVNRTYPSGRERLFEDGRFFTESGKAQFIAVRPRAPAHPPTRQYPLILNTGRVRDQWHTMTRTALATKLNQHRPESFVEIHPADAERFGLSDGGLATIDSAWGAMCARVVVSDAQIAGSVFVPMHWTEQYAGRGRVGALVNPVLDPISKQPESKHTPVGIQAYRPAWQGFILSRRELAVNDLAYWVKINGEKFFRYELADDTTPDDWPTWAEKRLAVNENSAWLEYQDSAIGRYRAAKLDAGRLDSVLFVAPDHHLPERGWLAGLFGK
ncbi:MAG: molybdopterin oxidoreductase family protein, partial [Gammaproteobacteria bacterium]